MNIPIIDRSNYLKGLFITAKLDKELTEKEKDILKKISDKLGFATDFFHETVRSLLINKYIIEEPIVFSHLEIAQSFIKDAVKLACVNGVVTDAEIDWLKKTADINKINSNFVEKEFKSFRDTPRSLIGSDLALYSII
ncbi:MAG: TerB family tellurite resistance protein [Ignavibacteriales bacterium]|nr:TerB family tellurite resistance protein [Ignavibacteriales bacterium]MBP9120789.1 TerB family tellurite resistance protein [Ignavibacterium sp.]